MSYISGNFRPMFNRITNSDKGRIKDTIKGKRGLILSLTSYFVEKCPFHLSYSTTNPFFLRSLTPWLILTGFLRVTFLSLNRPHSHLQSTNAAFALVMESWFIVLRSTSFSTCLLNLPPVKHLFLFNFI